MFFLKYLLLFIYLATPGLSCSMWNLVPYPSPLHWELRVLTADHQGSPCKWFFNLVELSHIII